MADCSIKKGNNMKKLKKPNKSNYARKKILNCYTNESVGTNNVITTAVAIILTTLFT